MWLSKNAIDLKNWKQLFEESGEALDLERFTAHVNAASLPHAVIIDCTSSEKIAEKYEIWLREKIHIITPNKKANSGQQKRYQLLQDLKRQHNVQYLYETTVCAGLPVIQTLRDLIQTGDQIQKIEGVFSGTLSYLFNSFDGRKNFSEIVREARDQGFTEPDPRDDLSGMDVARKVIILAREMGLELNLDQVAVENLVPEALRDSKINVEQFMAELPKYDNEMNEKLIQAQQQQQVLRYVGLIDPTMGTRVELKPFNLTHPFAGISGSDNILAFTSRRYLQQPLVVRGPGAGPEVTAGGIFADLLRLASHVGATL
jgi:aspartokinase/homoserine dehydrogenase 1